MYYKIRKLVFHFETCIAILFDLFCLFFSSFPCHHELEKGTFDDIDDRGCFLLLPDNRCTLHHVAYFT